MVKTALRSFRYTCSKLAPSTNGARSCKSSLSRRISRCLTIFTRKLRFLFPLSSAASAAFFRRPFVRSVPILNAPRKVNPCGGDDDSDDSDHPSNPMTTERLFKFEKQKRISPLLSRKAELAIRHWNESNDDFAIAAVILSYFCWIPSFLPESGSTSLTFDWEAISGSKGGLFSVPIRKFTSISIVRERGDF